jgi:alanine racemase
MKRRVAVEIDLDALVRNYRRIAEHVKNLDVLCVLKANAYGLGVSPFALALAKAGCRSFGVAEPYEAEELCSTFEAANLKADVQILSSILPDEILPMVERGVILPVTGLEEAHLISDAAHKAGKKARVHFKIDTGMGRLGIPAFGEDGINKALSVICDCLALQGLECEGIFSHCAMAYDPADPFTSNQIALFKSLVQALAEKGISFKRVHMAASDAVNNFPETLSPPFNTVRTGINLHGSFDPNGLRALNVESVLSLKTRVAQVRNLPAGTSLGYGRTYTLSSPSKIAVISAGYADGLPLQLGNRGFVFIGGKRCPVVGRVSMDYATVDVSNVEGVKIGDEVICFGRCGDDAITPDDWAALKGTHPYDIICSLGSRVLRKTVGTADMV